MSGFPPGLRPQSWMGDLVQKKLDPEAAKTKAVTDFRYPGSHDAATYGEGIADFSYQCQEKNLYEQMMVGQRCFDIRVAATDNGKKFIPVHGVAKNTADDFNQGPKEAKEKDLASQIMKFAKEHPSEIIILKMSVGGLDSEKDQLSWANAAWNLLGERLLEAPTKQATNPTYQHAVESNRNIILAGGKKQSEPGGKQHQITKYYWDVGANTENWLGDGNQLLWNEPTWQSGDIKKVIESTEEYIKKNQEKLADRKKFWTASLQLTPVLGQNIVTFFKDGGSVRPKDLALGGGIGSHGGFKGSNKEVRDSGVLEKPIWKQHASCIMYDFADTQTTGAIVAMNLDDGDEGHAGGGAGRGGGDHGEEHEGGGRGGGHGRGGGGHRGGRGRGHD